MDKTKPEDQNLSWYFSQCGSYSNLDSSLHLPSVIIHEI